MENINWTYNFQGLEKYFEEQITFHISLLRVSIF